jgi:hypothetical protein
MSNPLQLYIYFNSLQVPRFDPTKLVIKLRSKCVQRNAFNWFALGHETGTCFNGTPTGCIFLAGVLETDMPEKKARKAIVRKTKDTCDEQRPEVVREQQTDANMLSASEKTSKQLEKLLRATTLDAQKQETDAVEFLFNPHSFTQTVENIFHFSFLVKKGSAKICVRKPSPLETGGPKPTGLYIGTAVLDEGVETPLRQAVLSFTMKDWRAICKASSHKASVMPSRKCQA